MARSSRCRGLAAAAVAAAAVAAVGAPSARADCDAAARGARLSSFDPLGLAKGTSLVAPHPSAPAPDAVVRISEDFEVSYFPNYKLVRNLAPGFNETYVLTTCGSAPVPPEVPADAKHFAVPLQSVAVTDTTIIAFLEKLGLRETIAYADFSYAVNPCLHAARALDEADGIQQATASPNAYYSPGDPEEYAAMMDSVDAIFGSSADPSQPKSVAFTATADPGPLHRSEWIKFVSLFFNKEAQAEGAFAEIAERYECTVAGGSAVPEDERPGVAFINYNSWADPPEYQVSVAAYKVALIADAGGRNVDLSDVEVQVNAWTGDVSHVGFASAAELFAYLEANDVSVVIDEAYSYDPTSYDLAAMLTTYGVEALPEGVTTVLREDGIISATGSMDWFEGAVPFGDATLQDLARGIHGSSAGDAEEALWFRDIASGEVPTVLTESDCPDVTQPSPYVDVSHACADLAIAFPEDADVCDGLSKKKCKAVDGCVYKNKKCKAVNDEKPDCPPSSDIAARGARLSSFDPLGLAKGTSLVAPHPSAPAPDAVVRISEDFEVSYFPNYKLVRNLAPGFNETYVLTTCGSAPVPPEVPADAKHFAVPLQSVAVTDTTIIAFLEKLGLRETIAYADFSYAVNPCLHAARALDEADGIQQATASPNAYYSPGDPEEYAAMMDSVDAIFGSSADPSQPKSVAFTATADPGPLHRSEWIKFVSLFFNKEAQAEGAFAEIAERYECTVAGGSAVPEDERPGVAFINYNSWADPPEYQVSVAAYKVALIADAGGRNVDLSDVEVQVNAWTGDVSHVGFASAAELFAYLEANDVSVVIDEAYSYDPTSYDLAAMLTTYGVEALPEGVTTVLREDGIISATGSMDWFEGAVPFGDATLQDLARGIHGSSAGDAEEALWFRDIASGEVPTVLTESDCPDVTQPSPYVDVSHACADLAIAFPEDADVCDGLSKKKCKAVDGCVYKNKKCKAAEAAPLCDGLSKKKCKAVDGCVYKNKKCKAAEAAPLCDGLSKKKCKAVDGCVYKNKKCKAAEAAPLCDGLSKKKCGKEDGCVYKKKKCKAV